MVTILCSLFVCTSLQFGPVEASIVQIGVADIAAVAAADPEFAGSSLEGVVLDAETSAPLAGAKVEILGTGRIATSSDEGKYVIVNLPAGTYEVRASAEGYTPIVLKGIVVGKEKSRPVYCVLRKSKQAKTPPPDFLAVSSQPQALSTPPPKYPESARKLGVGGTIWLKAIVDQNGAVDSVVTLRMEMFARGDSAIDTSPGAESHAPKAKALYAAVDALVAAARETLAKWTFTPAVKDSKNVSVWVTVPFRFKLSDEGKKPHRDEEQAPEKK